MKIKCYQKQQNAILKPQLFEVYQIIHTGISIFFFFVILGID